MICRVLLGRFLSSEGLGMYMMALSTLGLALTLAQMGIPGAVFKLSADPKYHPKKILLTGLFMGLVNSLCMALFLLLFSKQLSHYLWHNPTLALSLEAIAIFIPMASINNTLRSYFLGQERLTPPALSQIIEECIRIAFMLFYFRFSQSLQLHQQLFLAFIAMVLGEVASSLFMLCFLKRKESPAIRNILGEIKKLVLYKDIASISIPVTASQLLHSLSNFLEPLILTSMMLKMGYSNSEINTSYGIISGYVLSLLMIPTFITTVVYRIALPKLTKSIANHQFSKTRTQLIQALMACLSLGLPFSILFYFFPDFCLHLFYHTNQGSRILKYLAWPFLIYYLQTPLSCCLHALSKNKLQFLICLIECLTSSITLYLTLPYFQATSVAISLLAGLICNTLLSFISVYHTLFFQKE